MASQPINEQTIAIVATHGFEQSELFEPLKALKEAGATVHVISPEEGTIKGWNHGEWGENVEVNRTLAEARPNEYDALVLPGGVMNPDKLRMNTDAVNFARQFFVDGKPVAAICHGPQLLIECDVLQGREMTSYPSIKTDLKNAGARWVDKEVVVDQDSSPAARPTILQRSTVR